MKIFNFTLILLASLSFTLIISPVFVKADEPEDSDEDAVINEDVQATADVEAETETEEEALDLEQTSSPFVKTSVLLIQPESTTDLPAGKVVRLLVGFQNNGSIPFLVETIDGAFRYPQDFSFYIQNFSTFEYNKVVDSDRESTFEYFFTPSEAFLARSLGLTINLRYRNVEGKSFVNTLFNETVNIVESNEGFDGETFFLYVFLAAIVILLAVVVQQLFSVLKKKSGLSRISAGQKSSNLSSNSNDVDLDWIPKNHLQQNNSPKTSPRQRKSARNGGVSSTAGNGSNDEQ